MEKPGGTSLESFALVCTSMLLKSLDFRVQCVHLHGTVCTFAEYSVHNRRVQCAQSQSAVCTMHKLPPLVEKSLCTVGISVCTPRPFSRNFSAIVCSEVQCITVQMVQSASQCGAVRWSEVQCSPVQCSAVKYKLTVRSPGIKVYRFRIWWEFPCYTALCFKINFKCHTVFKKNNKYNLQTTITILKWQLESSSI